MIKRNCRKNRKKERRNHSKNTMKEIEMNREEEKDKRANL